MQFERLNALAKDASMGTPCEIWGVPVDALEDAEKRPLASREAGALSEMQKVTIRDFADLAERLQASPSRMWAALEHLRDPSAFLAQCSRPPQS